MVPPNKGSSLFQESSLNMTSRKNCYISVYEGPNENFQDVLDRPRTLLSVVKFSEPNYEIEKRVSLYQFAILNSPKISGLGKTLISTHW